MERPWTDHPGFPFAPGMKRAAGLSKATGLITSVALETEITGPWEQVGGSSVLFPMIVRG